MWCCSPSVFNLQNAFSFLHGCGSAVHICRRVVRYRHDSNVVFIAQRYGCHVGVSKDLFCLMASDLADSETQPIYWYEMHWLDTAACDVVNVRLDTTDMELNAENSHLIHQLLP